MVDMKRGVKNKEGLYCDLLTTSPHHSHLGQPEGPSAKGGGGGLGLVVGLQVHQALGVLVIWFRGWLLQRPQVPRHPTSMCNLGVNGKKKLG